MFGSTRRRTQLAAAALACAAAAGALAITVDADPDGRRPAAGVSSTGCATAGATVAAVQTTVARRIYRDELLGTETLLDAARVRDYAPLLSALEASDRAGVEAAVRTLVFKPHWHIVRLRVLVAGRVLADVGGPEVTAPVSGSLRAHGRTLGRYVLSVQDDLGYVKLVTRFIGAPIDLYRNGSAVMGTLLPAPPAPAQGEHVTVGGRAYVVSNVAARAFPSGALQAALFVSPPPAPASCAALRIATWGSIARHVEARLHPIAKHYRDLASVLRAVTGGRVLVRSGSSRLVGGGPRRLPSAGRVSYGGRSWPVYSWQPAAGTRIYFLAPS